MFNEQDLKIPTVSKCQVMDLPEHIKKFTKKGGLLQYHNCCISFSNTITMAKKHPQAKPWSEFKLEKNMQRQPSAQYFSDLFGIDLNEEVEFNMPCRGRNRSRRPEYVRPQIPVPAQRPRQPDLEVMLRPMAAQAPGDDLRPWKRQMERRVLDLEEQIDVLKAQIDTLIEVTARL